MKKLTKLPVSLMLVIVLLGCSSSPTCPFDSEEDTCEQIRITAYLPPVVADLDYKNIRGSQNQVIVPSGYEHALSVTGKKTQDKALKPLLQTFPLPPVSSEKPNLETETVLFEFNHASVPLNELNKLKDFVNRIDSLKLMHIEIEGHADSIGSSKYNKKLSLKRARAVSYYLIQRGIPQSKISIKGFGEDLPAMPNDTEDHRAKNRRTKIIPIGGY